MSIYAPQDTRAALGANAERCESRALLLDRFPFQDAGMDEDRLLCFAQVSQQSFPAISRTREAWENKRNDPKTKPEEKEKLQRKLNVTSGLSTRRSSVAASDVIPMSWLPATARPLYARLMSRLMVNMAGGVMENAGLCLDRYGLPLIPGSAVKACARRMALQALHDWIAAGTEHPASDDACAPCCEGFAKPADMLAAIALVFGWVESDWEDGKKDGDWKSDLAWACHGNWDIWKTVALSLCQKFRRYPKKPERPWDSLPNFSGSIAFLGAQPNRDPGLELDVVTPHHTIYHSPEPDRNRDRQKWETWNTHRSAPDTEDPVPVIFPAVAPQKEGDYFNFPLIPIRRAEDKWLEQAHTWLAHGLELFGIGAKTNAGYGWFDASKAVQNSTRERIKAAAKAEVDRKQLETENAKRRADVEAERVRREQEAAVTAGMSDDEKADWKLSQLQDQQFESKLRNFFKEPKRGGPSENEKAAIIRALRGARLAHWQNFKTKASKGGDLAKAEQAIRAHCKSMNLGKMP